jgi:hypothetical protein
MATEAFIGLSPAAFAPNLIGSRIRPTGVTLPMARESGHHRLARNDLHEGELEHERLGTGFGDQLHALAFGEFALERLLCVLGELGDVLVLVVHPGAHVVALHPAPLG